MSDSRKSASERLAKKYGCSAEHVCSLFDKHKSDPYDCEAQYQSMLKIVKELEALNG